ncbi:MAG: 30S ribosomal protein S17 [Terriglobia bacterium]|jgi:small subunit ribosomal protein S17
MTSENMEVTPPQDSKTDPPAAGVRWRRRQKRVGMVSGASMRKTITVRVDRTVQHPLYKRIIGRSTKFLVHDEKNDARVGDTVEIEETRPMSRLKRWRLKRIIARAVQ